MTITNTSSDADIAAALSGAAASISADAGKTNRAALDANKAVSLGGLNLARDVSDDSFDFAGEVSDDSFGFAKGALDTLATAFGVVQADASDSREDGFEFAGQALDGFIDNQLEEGERQFNRLMTVGLVLGVAGIAAWAIVRAK